MNKNHVKNININCPLCGRIIVVNCDEIKCRDCQWENGCIPDPCPCFENDRLKAFYTENIQLKMELDTMIDRVEEYQLYKIEYNQDRHYKRKQIKLYTKKGELYGNTEAK